VKSIITKLHILYVFFSKNGTGTEKVGSALQHMWEQYIAINPNGYRNSKFGYHYKKRAKRVSTMMHTNHKASDEMYVDYARKTFSLY